MSDPAVPELPPNAPTTPPAPVLPVETRYDVTPYRPEGGVNLVGLLLMLVGLAVSGVILGVIVHYVSQYFYLILVFPFLIGLALGAIAAVLVKKGRIRSPIVAGVAGFLGGVTAMGTTHYLGYLDFLKEVQPAKQMLQASGKNPDEFLQAIGLPVAERAEAKRELLAQSFWDYLDIQATRGVEIKRAAQAGGKGANIGYTGTWIYWGIETLIVAGMVFAMARKPAQEPYCSVTDQWKGERCGDNFNVDPNLIPEPLGQMLRNGDLGHLAAVKAQGGAEPVRLYVYGSPDDNPQCTYDVKLVRFVQNKQGKIEEKEIAMATYPHEALSAFEKFCSVG